MRTTWTAFFCLFLAACGGDDKTSASSSETGASTGTTGTTDAGTGGSSTDAPTTGGGTDSGTGSGTDSASTGGETPVTVEDPRAMCMGNPLLPDFEQSTPPVAAPALMAQALGGGKVAVTETEYEENCGFTLTPVASAEAGTVTVTYETAGEPADCLCSFTIEYTLTGLTPGAWTIQSGALSTMVDVT